VPLAGNLLLDLLRHLEATSTPFHCSFCSGSLAQGHLDEILNEIIVIIVSVHHAVEVKAMAVWRPVSNGYILVGNLVDLAAVTHEAWKAVAQA
jgi:hypothetical protein